MSIKLFVTNTNPLEDSEWTSVEFCGEAEDLLSMLIANHWQRMGFEVGMLSEDGESIVAYEEPL